MAPHRVVVWTSEIEALLGTMADARVAALMGEQEHVARYRRIKLGVPAYRRQIGPVTVACANCGEPVTRPRKALRRSRRLYCTRECADAGQKRRDSETLRYGPGWKNRRAEIRKRDRVCRACGKTPKQNGGPLHVHHLKPFRFGGTNLPANLVALCATCHHVAEAMTTQTLDSIPVAVALDGSCLTIMMDGKLLWRGSVHGAGSPMPHGSDGSAH